MEKKETQKTIKTLFKGYIDYDSEEYNKIWKDALIVVDTNILLNLYRYSEDTKKELIKILKECKKRLWVPYQVIKEYFNNRDKVIVSSYDDYNKLINHIKSSIDDAKNEINQKKSKQLKCKDDICKILEQAARDVEQKLKEEMEEKNPKIQEQETEKTNLPVLGNVPLVSKKKDNKEKDLIVHNDPKSPISEGLRTIRTNLQFSNVDKQMKKIMITSSMPGEGKSFTSANLATAFAQDGAKVIIIDCDMRKGRLHKIFEISNSKGLSNLLIDNIEKNYKKYIKKTNIENLSIIPSGMIPPNPSELLNSEANKKLISILEKEYDYVIFDCVPINGLPDSLIMANLVNKAIIVCAAGVTPTELLQKTKTSLENVDAEIAGIVINKTKGSYNKYYGHYYG